MEHPSPHRHLVCVIIRLLRLLNNPPAVNPLVTLRQDYDGNGNSNEK